VRVVAALVVEVGVDCALLTAEEVAVVTGAEATGAEDATLEAAVLDAMVAVAQAEEAAARTARASVAPQAAKTQLVAADWMAASLAAEHWHATSVSLQVVAEETALAMQVVAQAGIWADARPVKAMTARAEYEYFIFSWVYIRLR
jgi:hypothetical protein